jgi:hypothetical protein
MRLVATTAMTIADDRLIVERDGHRWFVYPALSADHHADWFAAFVPRSRVTSARIRPRAARGSRRVPGISRASLCEAAASRVAIPAGGRGDLDRTADRGRYDSSHAGDPRPDRRDTPADGESATTRSASKR